MQSPQQIAATPIQITATADMPITSIAGV